VAVVSKLMLMTADSAAEAFVHFLALFEPLKRVSSHFPSAAIYEVAVSGTATDVE
jgi:hypothetical protein